MQGGGPTKQSGALTQMSRKATLRKAESGNLTRQPPAANLIERSVNATTKPFLVFLGQKSQKRKRRKFGNFLGKVGFGRRPAAGDAASLQPDLHC